MAAPVRCGDCDIDFVQGDDHVWRHPGICAEDDKARDRYNEGHN